jgi:dCMP deaminase
MTRRPSWKKYFKTIVKNTSKRSVCPRLQVGCLLVKKNRIISQGYNGYIKKCPHEPIIENNHNIATIHAEQNALLDCANRGVSCKNSVAYITHYPCFNCMKFLCTAGIKKIYYINDYNNNLNVETLSTLTNLKINKI